MHGKEKKKAKILHCLKPGIFKTKEKILRKNDLTLLKFFFLAENESDLKNTKLKRYLGNVGEKRQ